MRRSEQKIPHLWENMDQQNHRQETVLNPNESQQYVSANGKENVRCAVFTKDMCQVWASPTATSSGPPLLPRWWNSDPHHPPYFTAICPMWSIQISLNWFTGPAGSVHPQFIPTSFKIREVLGEGRDINRCTCANGVPADLWQRL